MPDCNPDAKCPDCGHRAFLHPNGRGCLDCKCKMDARDISALAGS